MFVPKNDEKLGAFYRHYPESASRQLSREEVVSIYGEESVSDNYGEIDDAPLDNS